MRVALYHSEKQRCNDLAAAIYAGVRRRGDECIHRNAYISGAEGIDVGIIQGVRRRELFTSLPAWIYVDKGYTRTWDWRRVAVNACEPAAYLGKLGMPSDRRKALGWRPKPWRSRGDKIVMCWSNEDEHEWRGLPPPEDHAEIVVRKLRHHTDRPIVYRCKPNRMPARPVPGTIMTDNRKPLADELVGAHAVVVVSGGSSIAALLAGIPAIVLGDAPTMSISSTHIDEIEHPRLAAAGEVDALFNDLAYCQWRIDEFASGEAWAFLCRRV
jgi:hypothetical protein